MTLFFQFNEISIQVIPEKAMKLNHFALHQGKIVYVPGVPEKPKQDINYSDDYAWRNKYGPIIQFEHEQYQQALQSAIANGVEVSNQDEVEGKLLVIHEHHNGFKLQPDKLYPLQCKVEIREEMYMTNPPRPTGYKVARVTFEQPEKLPISKDFATQLQAQCIINERDKIEPEAAGQEQETQEQLWEEMLIRYDRARMIRRGLKEVAIELMNEFTITRKP